jgi:hypothetical protein
MSISELMQAMADAGAPMEAILIAVKAIEERDAMEADRKAKRAEQKRQERARSATIDGQSRDCRATVVRQGSDNAATVARQTPSPSPPRDIINPPIPSPSSFSLRSNDETRDKRACAAREAAADFDRFWTIWPNKVGKPAAAKAFFKVRCEAAAILAGIPRYVEETERIGRPWLNPSTFLNQRRWEDTPAPTPTARAGPASAFEKRNPVFQAGLELMEEYGLVEGISENRERGGHDGGAQLLEFGDNRRGRAR